MLQFDEYKIRLNNLKPALDDLAQALDLEAARRELEMLESESAAKAFGTIWRSPRRPRGG